MVNRKIYILLLSLGSSIGWLSCCHLQKDDVTDEVTVIEIIKIDTWLNLMPGDSPTFHLVGEAIISTQNKINDLQNFFKSINVSQSELRLYNFSPVVNLISEELIAQKVNNYNIKFFTERGLRYNKSMKNDEKIEVEIIFNSRFNMKNVLMTGIQMEKAY